MSKRLRRVDRTSCGPAVRNFRTSKFQTSEGFGGKFSTTDESTFVVNDEVLRCCGPGEGPRSTIESCVFFENGEKSWRGYELQKLGGRPGH